MNKIQNNFFDSSLFDLAMTHRSWVNENSNDTGTNERLEFLGDAILEFVVSEYIYKQFPKEEEGFLTTLRANIVNTKNLSELAIRINIGEKMKLSKGEELSGGRDNISLLADTVEALIGAIFLDRGLKDCRDFIKTNLLHDLDEKLAKPLKDAKSRLQEKVQSVGHSAPRYRVVSESGPDHSKEFAVEVSVKGKVYASGKGKSKSIAEQEAAEAALVNFAKLN